MDMQAYQFFATYYDRLMADAPYERWQQFFQEALRKYSINPKRIVDIGCGTGTLSLFFSGQGMQVYAVDPSPDMLLVAQQKYWQKSQNAQVGQIEFLEADAASMELPEPVDVAVSFCDSLSYILDDAELEAAFRTVYRSLVPGGMFLFDLHTPYKITEVYGDRVFYETFETFTYIWETLVDETSWVVDHYLTFFVQESNGIYRKWEESHSQRGYQMDTVRKLMRRAGFQRIEIFGDFAWEHPAETCERYFIIGFREGND
jgi:ubiquinone/menaquinone biosynthesis C-methylase UbiE